MSIPEYRRDHHGNRFRLAERGCSSGMPSWSRMVQACKRAGVHYGNYEGQVLAGGSLYRLDGTREHRFSGALGVPGVSGAVVEEYHGGFEIWLLDEARPRGLREQMNHDKERAALVRELTGDLSNDELIEMISRRGPQKRGKLE